VTQLWKWWVHSVAPRDGDEGFLQLVVEPGSVPPVFRADTAVATVLLSIEQATDLARSLLAGTLEPGRIYEGEARTLQTRYAEDSDSDED
jgi:hypothetical protein